MNEEVPHKKRYRTLIKNTAKAAEDGIQKEHVVESIDVSFEDHMKDVNAASSVFFGINFNTEIIKE
tara:strand:- start:1828 stop:2025 length:198 start_codon:yes stop_codon:yes gene_type:complete